MAARNEEIELITTGDGSHSLQSHRFNVPYHSRHGAVQESNHVFIDAGLRAWLGRHAATKVDILEMGFGTGLNALLVKQFAIERPDLTLTYSALERFPITLEDAGELNYPSILGIERPDYLQLHRLPVDDRPHRVADNLTLAKSDRDFLEGMPAAWARGRFDVLFYDAFAPSSQPELWAPEALDRCYGALRPNGVLVTYCAKGQFKRDLRSAGFTVEPLPGPPGKREMTRAWK